MGDHRAGTTGSTATTLSAPDHQVAPGSGKRIARHSAEQQPTQPYVGRRIAQAAPVPAAPALESLPYAGRRVAGRNPVGPKPGHVEQAGVVTRRITLDPELASEPGDVVGHLLRPAAAPPLESYVGRRIARTTPLIIEPEPAPEPEPVVDLAPLLDKPQVVEAPTPCAELKALLEIVPVVEIEPVVAVEPQPADEKPKAPRPVGRRVATRRARIPSLPLVAGLAVLAISAGGALQAMHSGAAGASDARLAPAGALSGDSAVASANLLGSRGTVVSRDSDRQAAGSLQAAVDAQAKQRDAALSAAAAKAQKQAAEIKLHQWVLPVTPGVYHLTARFGDYSALWSHFHTGLDFAAPTGTPIMAVAGGTITEVGYSGAYGNRTIETLPDGTELWYCHQNEFGTSVGATVKPGQVIGYVGSTGNVTGPHLHLEVHPGGGDPVDPFTALQVHGLNP
jgi:murein DD-endopeptidase MepM/ murein hydrolase activator NlpD